MYAELELVTKAAFTQEAICSLRMALLLMVRGQ